MPEQSIEELLRFDPFESEGGDEGSGEAAAKADGGDDAGSQSADTDGQQPESKYNGEDPAESAADAGKPEDAAAAADGSDSQEKPSESREPAKESGEKDQEIAYLKEQIGSLSTQLQQVQSQAQAQAQPKAEGGASGEDDPIPDYQFQIPQQIADGIYSEDGQTRAQALNMLVAGIGQSVHKQVREEYQQKLKSVKEEIQGSVESHSERKSQVETIKQDYFGNYPNHDSELVRPLVQQKSREVMNEGGFSQWSATVRDEIGRRVNAELQKAGFGGQPAPAAAAPAQQNPGNGQAGPPHMRRSGARPGGAGSGGPNSEQDIHESLFG